MIADPQISNILAQLLADTYVLQIKTQNYHWNVQGVDFAGHHAFFEQQYTELQAAVDEIAERLRMIGSPAPGSMQQFLNLKRLPEADGNARDAQSMMGLLFIDHSTLIEFLRAAIKTFEEKNDPGTVDLFTVRLRAHEKFAWMLHASINP